MFASLSKKTKSILCTGLLSVCTATAFVVTPVSSMAAEGSYCLALRGNGDLEPAHWGALASLVEKLGLPEVQAGGSSATISMFLLDSIAANAWVQDTVYPEAKRRSASLLLKSLEGISNYIGRRPQIRAALTYFNESHGSLERALGRFSDHVFKRHDVREELALVDLVEKLGALGVGASPKYQIVLDALLNPLGLPTLNETERARLMFYVGDLKKGLSSFGSFDASSDPALLFRAGVVDFRKFGLGVGMIAAFLEGRPMHASAHAAFATFMNSCEARHTGMSWSEFAKAAPDCREKLNLALDAFFAQKVDWDELNPALRPAGLKIASLPTTTVLTGPAYREALDVYNRYHQRLNPKAADDFTLSDPTNVHFGYWGAPALLAKVQARLKAPFADGLGRRFDFSGDAKSAKFLALGSASWVDVMSLSPAEPGIASIQPMTVKGEPAFSVGGWSDLHPIPVLKAAGCDQVVYVTRKGGESLFAQGVAKRLLGLERDWDYLRKGDDELNARNKLVNALGDASDRHSKWSRLYNTANPASSFMTAVASSDAVLCTDWDRYDLIKDGVAPMVDEAYAAPFVLQLATPTFRETLTKAGARFVRRPYSSTHGKPDWSGCRPPSAD